MTAEQATRLKQLVVAFEEAIAIAADETLLGADPPSATVIGVHIDGRTWMP